MCHGAVKLDLNIRRTVLLGSLYLIYFRKWVDFIAKHKSKVTIFSTYFVKLFWNVQSVDIGEISWSQFNFLFHLRWMLRISPDAWTRPSQLLGCFSIKIEDWSLEERPLLSYLMQFRENFGKSGEHPFWGRYWYLSHFVIQNWLFCVNSLLVRLDGRKRNWRFKWDWTKSQMLCDSLTRVRCP